MANLHCKSGAEEDFNSKLSALLQAEGKSIDDWPYFQGHSQSPPPRNPSFMPCWTKQPNQPNHLLKAEDTGAYDSSQVLCQL